MTFLDFFSGIGGFTKGGVTVNVISEIAKRL